MLALIRAVFLVGASAALVVSGYALSQTRARNSTQTPDGFLTSTASNYTNSTSDEHALQVREIKTDSGVLCVVANVAYHGVGITCDFSGLHQQPRESKVR